MNAGVAVDRSSTLVWIDSREACIVRWKDGHEQVERLESDVPVHRRTTGGGRIAQPSVEGPRLEHLARFIERVIDKLPADDDLVIIGPGTVREHLLNRVEELDGHRKASRNVACRPARPMTVPQLVALLRHEIGDEPPRKAVKRRRRVARRLSRQAEEKEFSELIDEPEESI